MPSASNSSKPADQRLALADDELQSFRGLDRAHDSGQHAQHAAFGAGRNQSRRGRFGIQAAVARAAGSAENRDLALEAEDRAVNVGLAEQHAGIVHQIARGEIVRAVDDDVVVLEKIERVLAGQARFVRVDLNFRIQIAQMVGGRFDFGTAHVAGAEQHLALQVREIHGIEIHEADAAHARRGQIKAERRAESSGADAQHLGLLELELPLHAHFRHDQMAAVAQDLFFGKRRCRLSSLRRRRELQFSLP